MGVPGELQREGPQLCRGGRAQETPAKNSSLSSLQKSPFGPKSRLRCGLGLGLETGTGALVAQSCLDSATP